MLISLQSDLKKLFRLSLIIDLVNDSIGSNECRDSTTIHSEIISKSQILMRNKHNFSCVYVSCTHIYSLVYTKSNESTYD